jgi:hypothetical protein
LADLLNNKEYTGPTPKSLLVSRRLPSVVLVVCPAGLSYIKAEQRKRRKFGKRWMLSFGFE